MTYTQMIPTPPRTAMNTGLTPARVATLTRIFGTFRGLGNECGEVRNQRVRRLVETRSVGALRVTGITPALDSLNAIFEEVEDAHPDLYKSLGTAGMLCYRRVRGSHAPSNHAVGTAIDLTVGGILPDF